MVIISNSYQYILDNLDEVNKFLNKGNILKMTQEEIEHLSSSISFKEIPFIIINLSVKKSQTHTVSPTNSSKF